MTEPTSTHPAISPAIVQPANPRCGFIAIIGAPNAGKSSLLNRLAGSERAIVSETPGTTRDVIEARLDLGGMLVSLSDTAGLRDDPDNPVEIEGIRRTRINAGQADIRLLIIDAADETFRAGSVSRETHDQKTGRTQPSVVQTNGYGLLRAGDFVVFNKIDLARDRYSPGLLKDAPDGVTALSVSAKTGEGVEGLLSALTAAVAKRGGRSDDAFLTRARHVHSVETAIRHLERARDRLGDPELAAEDVRLAARALGEITGTVGAEDVLEAIFASFCIGK